MHKIRSGCYYLLILAFVIQSCFNSHPESGSNDNLKVDTSVIVQSEFNKTYLDTLRLKEMGIPFQKLETKRHREKWLLKISDPEAKSEQIQGLIYKIITYTGDSFESLFQLDSVTIQLPDRYQTLGFNGFGHYFHSYEALLKPEIR